MKNNIYLKNLDRQLKYFLALFLFTMSIGICTGLYYVYLTTDIEKEGIVKRFNGSDPNSIKEFEIEKPLENMILTTHDHILSFSMITLLIGMIFYFNSIISGKLKLFLLLEPYVSTILTFGSLWGMRYLNETFVYLVIISAIIMYICWYIMILLSLYELLYEEPS